jgi:hypothetical protein
MHAQARTVIANLQVTIRISNQSGILSRYQIHEGYNGTEWDVVATEGQRGIEREEAGFPSHISQKFPSHPVPSLKVFRDRRGCGECTCDVSLSDLGPKSDVVIDLSLYLYIHSVRLQTSITFDKLPTMKFTSSQFIRDQYLAPKSVLKANLTGKTVVIVGSNTGLGLEAAKHFASMNPGRLILACRNENKGKVALESEWSHLYLYIYSPQY